MLEHVCVRTVGWASTRVSDLRVPSFIEVEVTVFAVCRESYAVCRAACRSTAGVVVGSAGAAGAAGVASVAEVAQTDQQEQEQKHPD